ncbi:GumC family protein [Selenomonas ruminis]|uniref:Chain-length determining protein n=1 Tax=Selenomonas ruminis TaxID=2593411 RepID=A0A5D6W8N9_9FIRM|nr:GumC family protein [Selenomonas sp. mPRGC5]TYZ24851.1 chain-length determining protein [Selenomonas sp. mPRGC5]
MENEESIDLGRLMQIMLERKKVVGGIVAGCTALAIGTAFILPKQYESTTLVQTRSAGKDIGGAAAMAAAMGINIGGSSSNASPLNYIELMKSRRVLEPIIDEIEWPDDKKPDAKAFAKKNLKIENTKQTNLITVTATGRTPEEAQLISQGVVDNFLTMQTENSQQTQSLLVTFLNDRIENAKQEADDAAAKLAAFQKEHKLYSPSDQAKLAIEQLNAYDKTIGEMQVAQKSAQAQYDVATQKLGEQKAGAASYNINDNSTVQSIRAQIVAKEVELVGLRQKYTDNHPDVIAAKNQLAQLQQALSDEVGAVVGSNAASLNAAQMEILKNQAVAQAEASAATASEEAIKAKKSEKEAEIGKLPDAMMNYIQLESDAKIKQQIYLSLVQQCEQDKIQEAMESMDIQIIDAANLPDEDKPAAPRKMLIAIIGFVIGCLISFGYGLICYKREENV